MEKIYRSYYTDSNHIKDYMVNMLKLSPDDLVLEPCGGEGAFIDTLLEIMPDIKIDTVDINKEAINTLHLKYENNSNINIRKTDTLLDDVFDKYSIKGHYDKIIGNPPYGGWQDYEKRDLLKKKYNNFYVKETYSLFLLRAISLLKENGILSFIIPDTYLYLHNHKELRKYLVSNTSIKEILIFPSNLFPGVSFGYSNLSIITLVKNTNPNNKIRVFKNITKDEDFKSIMNNQDISNLELINIKQSDVKNNNNYSFYLNDSVANIMSNSKYNLGDLAECVTGIYTGNNKKYIYAKDKNVKRSKGYNVIDNNLIDNESKNLKGVSEDKKYIPLIKGNSETSYVREKINWYIDWTPEAIDFYNNDKKARFQNSAYYFQKGIAVPMVKSTNIRATMFEGKVFDQSVVGVFPKDPKYYLFILGLLNSKIARDLLFNINPTANSSANYLKRIPIVIPTDKELEKVNKLTQKMINDNDNNEVQIKIDNLFFEIYNKISK